MSTIAHSLVDHAAIAVVLGPLLGLDELCVKGGLIACLGIQPLGVMILLAFQGQVLAELVSLTSKSRRWHHSIIIGAHCSRRLGLTRLMLDQGEHVHRWLLAIYCLVCAAALAAGYVAAGCLAGTMFSMLRVDIVGLCPAIGLASAVCVALLKSLRRRRLTRKLELRSDRSSPECRL